MDTSGKDKKKPRERKLSINTPKTSNKRPVKPKRAPKKKDAQNANGRNV